MKTLFYTILIIFSFSKKIKAQFIDTWEFMPLEVNLFFASNTFLDTYGSSEKTWMVSYAGDLKLNKSIHENIHLQLGLRYHSMRYNLSFWTGTIEEFFQELRNEVITVPMGMENLVVRRVRVRDKFITIPIGGKYFFSDPREIISGYISGYYQPSFLIAEKTEPELAIKGGFLFPTYTPVTNNEFEPLVEEYFDNRKTFISSFQLGLGGSIKISEVSLINGELQWNRIADSLHEEVLYKQNGIGIKFSFTFFFSKKDKQTPPLK